MPFAWNLPNHPPDQVALERMKQQFPKPSELMPVAWFIGAEIKYYTWLAENSPDTLDVQLLADAMGEIAGGIVAFPEVSFVGTWQAWFKYLLPYAIAQVDQWSTSPYSVLVTTLAAFISIYPQEIYEEYEGFREDIFRTLGVTVMPYIRSLDELDIENVLEYSPSFAEDGPRISDDFCLPMLFALKYSTPLEIEEWVESLVSIKNYAWRFAIIGWWLALHQFQHLAENWPQDGTLKQLLDVESGLIIENGLVDYFWISRIRYKSLDAFIPPQNLITFQEVFARHLTIEVFQSWAADITSHRTIASSNGVFPIPERIIEVIMRFITTFEQQFFRS